jgi:hypothetical protein
MKRLMLVALMVLLAFSFSACAALKKEDEKKIRVKCPACGYEFEVPTNGG